MASERTRYGLHLNEKQYMDDYPVFKIKYKSDSTVIGNFTYPIIIKSNELLDTIQLISDLLSFEGDTSICFIPVSIWNPSATYTYGGKLKEYSIQVEALFIISQLYFKRPFWYSPSPVIINTITKKEASIKGEVIKEAYKAYKQWFEKVKIIGLTEARKQLLLPFDNTSLAWAIATYAPKFLFIPDESIAP